MQTSFSFIPAESRKCRLCFRRKFESEFTVGRSRVCIECFEKYRKGVTEYRTGLRTDGAEPRVLFVARSTNRKTGPIPVSMTSAETCPPSCEFYNAGCYGECHSILRHHWRRAESSGLSWDEFLVKVRALPQGQLWRHNEVGDLPGVGEELDIERLSALVEANWGRKGFTYTHKRLGMLSIRDASQDGFCVNVSARSLEEARDFRSQGLPVVMVLPRGATCPRDVVVCPASVGDTTCLKCGLCAKARRKSIVGFPAHGGRVSLVEACVKDDGLSSQKTLF